MRRPAQHHLGYQVGEIYVVQGNWFYVRQWESSFTYSAHQVAGFYAGVSWVAGCLFLLIFGWIQYSTARGQRISKPYLN